MAHLFMILIRRQIVVNDPQVDICTFIILKTCKVGIEFFNDTILMENITND